MGSSGANPRKKGEYSLLSEITSEEEWTRLSSKEGLFIIDVYSEWSGPCLAMTNFLKKIKLEINDDLLHYASAKVDTIPSLSKFQGLCRPLWLVLSFGQVVAVVHGANAPLLGRVIETEIENEKMVLAGEKVREPISLEDVLSDFIPIDGASLYQNETDADPPMEDAEVHQNEHSVIDDFALLILPQIDESLFSHVTEFLSSSNFVLAKHLVVQDEDELIKGLIPQSEDIKEQEEEEPQSFNLLLITTEAPIEKPPNKGLEACLQDPNCPIASPEFGVTLAKKYDFVRLLEIFFLEKDSLLDLLLLFLEADAEENASLLQELQEHFVILKSSSTCLITESLRETLTSNEQMTHSDKLIEGIEMSVHLLKGKYVLQSSTLFDSRASLLLKDSSQSLLAEIFNDESLSLEYLKGNEVELEGEEQKEDPDPVAFLSSLVGN